MFIRKLPASCAGLALISAIAAPAAQAAQAAQGTDWPTKPVTILAPFAAGGTVDLVARVLAVTLQRELGQPFLVDNRGGAGGTIATAMLARAAPDGYTLMVHHMGLVFSDSLYSHLPYNTKRDIMPVAYVGATPNVLVVTKSLPVSTMSDFLTLAKAKPGAINYGSGGVGSAGRCHPRTERYCRAQSSYDRTDWLHPDAACRQAMWRLSLRRHHDSLATPRTDGQGAGSSASDV